MPAMCGWQRRPHSCGGRHTYLLALLQRTAEAVETLHPCRLEIHREGGVLEGELEVLVHALAALLLAHAQVAQRAVAQHLVV